MHVLVQWEGGGVGGEEGEGGGGRGEGEGGLGESGGVGLFVNKYAVKCTDINVYFWHMKSKFCSLKYIHVFH